MPSPSSTYFEKCRTILPEMEAVLKQYNMWVCDGVIDQELLRMSSGHLIYKDLRSIIRRKYVYGHGTEFSQVTFYLFSDQSHLFYIEGFREKHKNLCDLLIHEEVLFEDFAEYQKQEIQWLIDHKYLTINPSGHVKIYSIKLIYILTDLYYNEVLVYWNYGKAMRAIIDSLAQKDMVEFEDTLFSRPEQDYFNYCLNKSSFNNALDLRNMYSHGTQPTQESHIDIHDQNYMLFLELMILEMIKINDELCIADNSDYKTENENS
jgi:hypothetical protein